MRAGPLDGETVSAADWPAARLAAEVLERLGARLVRHRPGPALTLGRHAVESSPSTLAEDWAASGLMGIARRRGRPPVVPRGAPATLARALALAVRALGGPAVDGAAQLGARLAELTPTAQTTGTVSVTGDTRLLPTRGGWIALTLSRPGDLDLVPALVGHELTDDPWSEVGRWASGLTATEAVDRGTLLGLPTSAVSEHEEVEPWRVRPVGAAPPRRTPGALVVNLGTLWAAPLAAHLLRDSGARVIDVDTGRAGESTSRWREELRRGHERVSVDLTTSAGRDQLRELLVKADVVLEASRPRALRQLGLAAEQVPGARARAWVRITGHPRPVERVAFGDDAAAAGGLLAWDDGGPVFVGDAIADPLTGLTAAVLALACCRGDTRWTADVSLASTAAHAARYPQGVGKSV